MDSIKINGKSFKTYIKSDEIQSAVKRIAAQIDKDLKGENPLIICVLNGAMIFTADLIRNLTIECEMTSMRIKSYNGIKSQGEVKSICGLTEGEITGRSLLIVEDIVDTGLSMYHITKELKKLNPRKIRVAALLSKPDARKYETQIDYAAFTIPNDFIVGYGLDYNESGRYLNDIYVIDEQ
ncbi:MAG: hypoxanthine phosphoribosyltransferase [Bacteroidales bacterium]